MQKFYIEFGGFYDSFHSDKIDREIESSIQFIEDDIDWEATHEEYARTYLKQVSEEIGISLRYKGLWRPKFYNFESDEIEAEMTERQFTILKTKMLGDQDFINWVDENSKSRDGFASFYSGFDEVVKENEILLRYYFNYIHTRDFILEILSQFEVNLIEIDNVKLITN